MDEIPDPYSDDAWDPDESAGDEPAISLTSTHDVPSATDYFEVLEIDRTETLSRDRVEGAFEDKLLATNGDGDERRARLETRVQMEARDELLANLEVYARMIDELGPRLGHQTYLRWRIVGSPPDVDRWIVENSPENLSFTDRGFEELE